MAPLVSNDIHSSWLDSFTIDRTAATINRPYPNTMCNIVDTRSVCINTQTISPRCISGYKYVGVVSKNVTAVVFVSCDVFDNVFDNVFDAQRVRAQ